MSAQHPRYVPQVEDPVGGSEVIEVEDATTLLILNPLDTGIIDNVYIALPEKANGSDVKTVVTTGNVTQVSFLPPSGTDFLGADAWAIGEGGYVAFAYVHSLTSWVPSEVYNATPV